MNAPKTIGILGGTFDPPHTGHLKLASHFAKVLHLDELLLIPSGESWQKDSDITSAEIRLQLTQAAGLDLAKAFLDLQISTKIGVDRIEIDRAGPSYTIDTVQVLRERFGPQASLTWLMGADSLIQLPTWDSWKELFEYINLAVASRPHFDLATQMSPEIEKLLGTHQINDPTALENSPAGRIYIDKSLSIDLSSTELRNHLKTSSRGQIASKQISTHTLEIITKLGLYQ